MAKEFINAQEAADYLGIKLGYLYKLTHGHKVPFYSPRGRILLFKVEELRAYVEKSRVATTKELESHAETRML